MIVQATKLSIAFLSASLAYAAMTALLPYINESASAGLATFGMAILFALLLYGGLRKLLAERMTYVAFVLTILIGIAVFYLTAL